MSLAYWVYRAVRGLARVFFPRPALEGLEHLPDGPCVIVGNHAQMYGPVMAELYLPGDRSIWCNEEMMHLKEVPDYAFRDFWSKKPARVRWFYRLLSYAIAPISVCVFNNARCIGVYRDMRILGTLRQTVARLAEGARIVIFPEHEVPHNQIVYEFQDRFISVARFYTRQTGKPLDFVPMYVAPKLKKVIFGPPVRFDVAAEAQAEQRRVCDALMDAITGIAVSQPRHRVVPYPNLPRRDHPFNLPTEEGQK